MKKILASVLLILGIVSPVLADITDGKFTTAQVWDVQYYWSGNTLNASGFNYLYASVNYATQTTSAARLTAAQIADAGSNGRYFAFFNSTTNPGTYGLGLYEADGTLYKVINNTGTFTALGDGAIFYLGNGMWGTVITPEQGFNLGGSGTFTNMNRSVTSTDLTSYTYTNTVPLAAGQTAGSSSPTVVSTAPGTPLVNITSSVGSASTTVNTNYAVSENDTHQTLTTTVTTAVSTPTTTTTCTTPTTVTTYSDGSTTTTNGTQTCTSATTTATTSSDTVNEVSGRIDQMATIIDVTKLTTRWLEFDGVNAIASTNNYDNGMKGSTKGFTAGHKTVKGNGIIFGLGGGYLSSDVDNEENVASSSSTIINLTIGKQLEKADVEINLTRIDTDYSYKRSIGNNNHSASASGSDTSITATVRGNHERFQPILGASHGKRTVDGYTESGPALTARSVNKVNDEYTYGIIGARVDFGIPYVDVIRFTDGVNLYGVGLSSENENLVWKVGVERLESNLGHNDRLLITFNYKW